MEENHQDSLRAEGEKKNQDCGCSDGCCQPKKKNIFSKLIFAVIMLAALSIIGIKLAGGSGNVIVKHSVAPGAVAGCDTTKTTTCDTIKGSSCCSKK